MQISRAFLPMAWLLGLSLSALGCADANKTYEAQAVVMGDIRDVVPAVGELRPLTEVNVTADVAGRVTAVYVQPNAEVREGQPLARLKPDRAALSVEAARADLSAAQAGIRQAQSRSDQATRDLSNKRQLAERGFSSPGVLATAETTAAEARAGVDRAEAEAAGALVRLRTASVGMEDIVIRAPSDGVVLSSAIEVGAVVGPASTTPLFVIASQGDAMRVRALVAEPDIGRLAQGMEAKFRVEAYPQREFIGKVIEVLRSPIKDRTFVSYPVIVEVLNADRALFPGMTASVEFIHTDVRNVLKAPLAALYFTPDGYLPSLPEPVMRRLRRSGLDKDRDALLGAEVGGLYAKGQRRVFVLTPDGPSPREVSVGAEANETVEITSGLSVGDRVVTGSSARRPAVSAQ